MSISKADIDLLSAAYHGQIDRMRAALKGGANVECISPETGLSPIHMAVGRSQLEATRLLIEEAGASLKPDRSGRWPTLIAAECEVSEEMADYIVEQEAQALEAAENGESQQEDKAG